MARKKMTPKPKPAEKTDVRLRMDAELAGRIEDAAKDQGLTVAAWLRSLAIRELKRLARDEV